MTATEKVAPLRRRGLKVKLFTFIWLDLLMASMLVGVLQQGILNVSFDQRVTAIGGGVTVLLLCTAISMFTYFALGAERKLTVLAVEFQMKERFGEYASSIVRTELRLVKPTEGDEPDKP